MFLIIVTIIVVVVLVKIGVFRHPEQCKSCGKTLKGTEQQVFSGNTPFCLCKDCADKINPHILSYAKSNWTYLDYTNYLDWEDSTKEERAQFKPNIVYGNYAELKIDIERELFSLGTPKKNEIVFRFKDLIGYDLNFKPEEIKEGILGDKVKGHEFIDVQLDTPSIDLGEILKLDVRLKIKKNNMFNTKYVYEYTDEFENVVRAFSTCVYIELARREGELNAETVNIGEVEKALALFMFDSMDDVTQDVLKKQRNTLIKAFHPDNAEQNEAYSQKINAAYELLSGMVKK